MYSLTLSNGARWWLLAGDEKAVPIVDEVASAMQLTGERSIGSVKRRHLVQVFAEKPAAPSMGVDIILPKPRHPEDVPFIYYLHISLALTRSIQREGGLLLHAALAEYSTNRPTGGGVIFSAPGGTGKSTASRRLPAPWRSWSDDSTLIVPSEHDQYRAHPWPTWSRYLYSQEVRTTWDVHASIPLVACVFLKQAPDDAIERIGSGQAASLLTESARQVNYWDYGLEKEDQRALRLKRFDTACALARSLPAYLLHMSLDGFFWREVEWMFQ